MGGVPLLAGGIIHPEPHDLLNHGRDRSGVLLGRSIPFARRCDVVLTALGLPLKAVIRC